MNFSVIKARILSLGLLILFFANGCATPDSKQKAADAQTAADRQFIVVPVFILSTPHDGAPSRGGDILPVPSSPDQTTRLGEPPPAQM